MKESMGIATHVLHDLVHHLWKAGIHDTWHVSAEEQVSIFVRLIVYGMGNHEAQECFQRSGDTNLQGISLGFDADI